MTGADEYTVQEVFALLAPLLDCSAEDMAGYILIGAMKNGRIIPVSNGHAKTMISLMLNTIDAMVSMIGEDNPQ